MLLITILSNRKNHTYNKQIRQVNNDKLAELSIQLRKCDWSECDNVNPIIAVDSLNDKLLSLYSSTCPEKTHKNQNFWR